MDQHSELEILDVVARRLDFLEHLRREPAYKPALVDAMDHSRSTVDRAVDELEAGGLIERGEDGYVPTQLGELAAERYSLLLENTRTLLEAKPVLDAVPPGCDLPFELFVGARVDVVDGPYGAFTRLADRLRAADSCRIVLPRLVDSRHVRLWHAQVVRGSLDVELLAPPAVLDRLREEFPELTNELADADAFTAHGVETPPYGLVLTAEDTGDSPAGTAARTATATATGAATVFLLTYGDEGVAGVVETATPGALEWAHGRYDQLRERGEVATGQLQSRGAGGELSTLSGLRLPPVLRSAGFAQLDEEFLEGSEAMAPETSWRAGIGLPEVAAGHAVERHRRDGTPLADALFDRLVDGRDVALVGPAGSGKSTVCKQVACRWVETHDGVALYREGGAGGAFQSPSALESVLERTADPVLVVVEDAVRSDTSRVFEVMRGMRRGDVRFLLDAREDEWRDPEGTVLDARLDAFRREAVDVVPMPPVDDSECRRLLDGAEAVLGTAIDVDPADLLAEVRSAGHDATTPGTMLLLSHRLARRTGPLTDHGQVPTTLDEDVDSVRRALSEVGDVAFDAGVLVNALNAAGVELSPALAYTVAEPDRPDEGAQVERALDRLEGHVLFRGPTETGYRGIHESWSERFLERTLEVDGEHAAAERFGRCLSALFALADEPGRCEELARAVGGRVPVLDRITANPGEWADDVVETLFEMGWTNAGLAPLFGTGETSAPVLPEACSSGTKLRCLELRGRMHLVAGEYDRARAEFDQLLAAARDRRDRSFEVEAVRQLGRVALQQGEYERAREHLARSLEAAQEVDDRETEATVRNDLGAVAWHRGDYGEAREYYEGSLDVARDLDARQLEGKCLNNLGLVAWRQGDYERAREHLERSLVIYRELGERRGVARCLNNLGVVTRELGDYDRVSDYYGESLEIRRDVGDRAGEATSLNNLGEVEHRQGRYDRAREYYGESLEIRRDIGDRAGEASALHNLGEVEHRQGRYDRAREYYEESLEIRRDIGDRAGEAETLANLGACTRRRGDYERAREHLERSLRLSRELGNPESEIAGLRCLGALSHSQGETDEARRYLEEALQGRTESVDPLVLAQTRLARARVALADGDPEDARELAERARGSFEGIGATHWLGRTGRLLGEVAATDGALEEARDHWEAALETFETVEAPQDALATLKAAVETGNDDREWYRRARELVADAPGPVGAEHEGWVERHTVEEK